MKHTDSFANCQELKKAELQKVVKSHNKFIFKIYVTFVGSYVTFDCCFILFNFNVKITKYK